VKKEPSKWSTRTPPAEVEALAALPGRGIVAAYPPELLDWPDAERGVFYRPVKQQLTLRLDADVVAWFKRHETADEGYQTRINRALREYVQEQSRRAKRSRRD
jgi:hypothetical protein